MNILLVGRRWPLEKRGAIICARMPEGEPPNTPEEIDQWQRGPKIRRCFQELIFRGFRVTVEVSGKDHPSLNNKSGALKSLGVVVEIISPNKARFSQAGVLKIQIKVVDETEKGIPPLTPDEKRQVCDIEDILEGRRNAAQIARDALGAVLGETRKASGQQTRVQASRKNKDNRPLPDEKIRVLYKRKIAELVPKHESNREVVRLTLKWAKDRQKDTEFKFYRQYRKDSRQLQRWAAEERGILTRKGRIRNR